MHKNSPSANLYFWFCRGNTGAEKLGAVGTRMKCCAYSHASFDFICLYLHIYKLKHIQHEQSFVCGSPGLNITLLIKLQSIQRSN